MLLAAIGMMALTLAITSQMNEPWAGGFRAGGAVNVGLYIFGAGVRLREREHAANEE